MELDSFFLLPSVAQRKEDIVHLIRQVDSSLKLTEAPTSNTLIVGTASEVFLKFGSRRYYVTINFLEDCVKYRLITFPISNENRQFVSLCLAPLCVSTVGFSSESMAEIAKYTLLLGGSFSRNFDDSVTMLIARTALSPKIEEARRNGLPIVQQSWIKECYLNLSRAELKSHTFQVFQNLTFTSSDLTSKDQKNLRELVHQHGGNWKDTLDDTVDLVIASGFSLTAKIDVALSSSIPIVRPEWITDSVSRDGVPLSDYTFNWWVFGGQSDLFKDITFAVSSDALEKAIEANGGKTASTADATYIVVPTSCKHPPIGANVVTERWVWSCIDARLLLDVSLSVLFRPLPFRTPARGMNRSFALLRMPTDQRLELSDAVRALGGTALSRMHRTVDVAVLGDGSTEAAARIAKRYPQAAVVGPGFIRAALLNGSAPPEDEHRVGTPKQAIARLCRTLLTARGEPAKLVRQTGVDDLCEFSPLSETSEAEADVIVDIGPRRKARRAQQEADPLISALSSAEF